MKGSIKRSKNKITPLVILSLLCAVPLAEAAEYIQMKAQGYQPVISIEEANHRDVINLEEDMKPLPHQGTGRKTTLEKPESSPPDNSEAPAQA